MRVGTLFLMTLFLAVARAGDDGDSKEGSGDGESTFRMGGDSAEDPSYELDEDDPPPEATEEDDPERPPPIQVGQWTPPELDAAGIAKRRELLDRCEREPASAGARMALGEFHLERGLLPEAERDFLRAAELEPDSVRPWEGLLRVYRTVSGESSDENFQVVMLPNGGFRITSRRATRQGDWLPEKGDRERRIARAYDEILRRRPDDVVRRREFVTHLVATRDFARAAAEARAVLERAPGDVDTRYELAEALRRTGDAAGAEAALEENLRQAPDHPPSLLRLARLIARREGRAAAPRILALERRAFFHMFVPRSIAVAPYRDDTVDQAVALAGPGIATRLWDDAMKARWAEDRMHAQRWLELKFVRALHGERMEALGRLGRRDDEAAVGAVIGLLWHLQDAERWIGVDEVTSPEF